MKEHTLIAVPKAIYEVYGKKYYIIELRLKCGNTEIPVAELKDLNEENFLVYEPERFKVSTYGPAFRIDPISEISVEETIQMAIESASKALTEGESSNIEVKQLVEQTTITRKAQVEEKAQATQEKPKLPFLVKLFSMFKKKAKKEEKKEEHKPKETPDTTSKNKFPIKLPKISFKLSFRKKEEKPHQEKNKQQKEDYSL